MTQVLLIVTLVVTAAVVLVLVGYLLAIIVALWRAKNSLKKLATHLMRTREQTDRLGADLQAINSALPELRDGLLSVNRNLEAIRSVAGRASGGGDSPRRAGAA